MCGIVGIFGQGTDQDQTSLERALEAIKHRGPDMSGVRVSRFAKVGFNRLSINDLSSAGMQPFVEQEVAAYMNGEIYNHKELKERYRDEYRPTSGSDAAIIPFLYRKFGIQFLNQINGMFAMVILDERTGECYLALDRFGAKPFYYREKQNALHFASELKAIRKMAETKVSSAAVKLALSCGGLPYPMSPFDGVKRLEPGTLLKYSRGRAEIYRWYHPAVRPRASAGPETREEFMALFSSAVKLRLECDVEVGGYISGGMDSTSILAVAKKHLNSEMHVFNAVIQDKNALEPISPDNVNAQLLARDLGLQYHRIDFNWDVYNRTIVSIAARHDEMLVDSGSMIFYRIAEEAQKRVKVLLDGVGGDEMFGGYPWQRLGARLIQNPATKRMAYSGRLFNPRVAMLTSKASTRLAHAYKAWTNLPLWHMQSLGVVPMWLFGKHAASIYETVSALSRERLAFALGCAPHDEGNAMQFCNYYSIVGFQTTEADRGGMAHSIEGRSPFLDYRLVEFMMGIGAEEKWAGGQKGLMRKWFSDILPDYVTRAGKGGPSLPLGRWLTQEPTVSDAIARFLRHHLDLIEELLGAEFAAAIQRGEPILFKTGLIVHMLIAVIIWAKVNISERSFDRGQTLLALIQAG